MMAALVHNVRVGHRQTIGVPPLLPAIVLRSAKTTAVVMLLVGTSQAMSWALSYERILQMASAADHLRAVVVTLAAAVAAPVIRRGRLARGAR